jgi:hypothetical protein
VKNAKGVLEHGVPFPSQYPVLPALCAQQVETLDHLSYVSNFQALLQLLNTLNPWKNGGALSENGLSEFVGRVSML